VSRIRPPFGGQDINDLPGGRRRYQRAAQKTIHLLGETSPLDLRLAVAAIAHSPACDTQVHCFVNESADRFGRRSILDMFGRQQNATEARVRVVMPRPNQDMPNVSMNEIVPPHITLLQVRERLAEALVHLTTQNVGIDEEDIQAIDNGERNDLHCKKAH
jgi:hypothetical protein